MRASVSELYTELVDKMHTVQTPRNRTSGTDVFGIVSVACSPSEGADSWPYLQDRSIFAIFLFVL